MKLIGIVKQHIAQYSGFYTVSAAAFLAGGLVAAFSVFSMPELKSRELALYLNDFFASLRDAGTDGAEILRTAALTNLKSVAVLIMLSFMIIGAPFVAAFCAFRGYTAFFTLLLAVRIYGIRAALFFLAGMLPHWLILFPCYGFLITLCMRFSLGEGRERGFSTRSFGIFFAAAGVVYALTFSAALIEAYVEPLLLSLISKYFI